MQGACIEPIVGALGSLHRECSLINRIFKKILECLSTWKPFTEMDEWTMLPTSLVLPKDTCLANRRMQLKPTQRDSTEFAMNPSVILPVPIILLPPHTYDNIHSNIFFLLIPRVRILFYFAPHSSHVRQLHAGMLQGSVSRSLLPFWILSQWDVIIHIVIISFVDLARTQLSTL